MDKLLVLEKKPREKQKLPRIDKASWYCYKFAQSVGQFKAKPDLRNFEMLLKTTYQVHDRLGVAVDDMVHIMNRLRRREKNGVIPLDTADIIELNEAAKMIFNKVIAAFVSLSD